MLKYLKFNDNSLKIRQKHVLNIKNNNFFPRVMKEAKGEGGWLEEMRKGEKKERREERERKGGIENREAPNH